MFSARRFRTVDTTSIVKGGLNVRLSPNYMYLSLLNLWKLSLSIRSDLDTYGIDICITVISLVSLQVYSVQRTFLYLSYEEHCILHVMH